MKDIEKRIREIVAEISAITEFAEGSIAANSKQYTLKNGTVRRASPQYRFKSRGARGKQVSKYVPPAAAERLKALPHLDESLAKAVSEDMSAYMGEVVSSVAFRSNAPKVNPRGSSSRDGASRWACTGGTRTPRASAPSSQG